MSITIPAMPKKKAMSDPDSPDFSGVSAGASSTAPNPNLDPNLAAEFNFKNQAVGQDAQSVHGDEQARLGMLFRGNIVGDMLEDPGGDRRAAHNAALKPGEMVQTPTRAQSAQERDYLSAQVAPAEAADARRKEAIAAEAAQIQLQQQIAAGEATRAFEQKYGVPYDKDNAKMVMDAERTQAIEDEYNQSASVLQSYLAKGRDSRGKPYDATRYKDDLQKLGITRGLRMKAPEGYFKAVAPPDPYGLGGQASQPSTTAQALQPPYQNQ